MPITLKKQLETKNVSSSSDDNIPDSLIKIQLRQREAIAQNYTFAAKVFGALKQKTQKKDSLNQLLLLRRPSLDLDAQYAASVSKVQEARNAAHANGLDVDKLLQQRSPDIETNKMSTAEKEVKKEAEEKARLKRELSESKIKIDNARHHAEAKAERIETPQLEAEVARRERLFGIKPCLLTTVITRNQIKEALERITRPDINAHSLRTLLLCYYKLPRNLFFTHQVINDDHNIIKAEAISKLYEISSLSGDSYITMKPEHLRCLIDSSGVGGSLLKKIVEKFRMIAELYGFRQAVLQNCKRKKDYTFEMKDDMDPERTIFIGPLDSHHNQDPSYRKPSRSCISI